jgi:DNA-directed RNA polymerase, mitochondrial
MNRNYTNNTSKYTKNEMNAFYKIYRLNGIYKEPQVKMHPNLSRLFKSSLMFEATRLPMLILPLPWSQPTQGGYFLYKSDLLRLGSGEHQQRIMIDNAPSSRMHPIFDSLNTLGSCAWRINTQILDLIIKIFRKNGNDELEVPKPSFMGPEIPKLDKK